MVDFNPLTHAFSTHPEFGEYRLTDHLPMAAFALGQLGATDERIRQFAAKYRIGLEPASIQSGNIANDDVLCLLGKASNYNRYLRYYHQQIEDFGSANALQRYLQTLANGLCSRAFHGAIRTAYGVDSDNHVEIAAGLAYWSDTLEVINVDPDTSAKTANLPIVDQLDVYSSVIAPVADSVASYGNSISERMAYVAALPDLLPLLRGSAATPGLTLSAIAGVALRIYLSTSDFTALHCVTGTHSIRVLEPFFDDTKSTLSTLWVGICMAYCAIGAPKTFEPQCAREPCSWDTIKRAAIRSIDDHDIKFVYSCLKEEGVYGTDLYRRAAALRMGL